MRTANCDVCGSAFPAAEMFVLYNKPICRPCAEVKAKEAATAGHRLEFARVIDATICGMCKVDYGSSDLPFIGGVPICGNCSPALYARAFPGWLKLSMAGLLLLLAGGLWRGVPYFKAGRHLVLAERAMDRRDYHAAALHFHEVLKIEPNGQKVLLLGAKANLLAGDPFEANKFLKRQERYQDDELFREVNGMWKRANDAYEKVERASKLEEAHKDEEAARLMHEASNDYPESLSLALSAQALDGGVAFLHKDYDGFLRISQSVLQRAPDDPTAMGAVASALACKYAVTGDPEMRKQSEQILEKARIQAQRSPEAKASFDEYAERIRYRLETREIIDTDDYNRRFRQKAKN